MSHDNNFGSDSDYYGRIDLQLQPPQTNTYYSSAPNQFHFNLPESQLEQIPGPQQSPRFGANYAPSPSVGIPDYIADMSDGNNRRGNYTGGNNFSPRGGGGGVVGRPAMNQTTMAPNYSNYNYGRNPYQGSPDPYFRGGTVSSNNINNQPAKSKNKNEWNYYINQAAAVGKNKPASVPMCEENAPTQSEASNYTYTNWGPSSASIEQGTVFNGLAQNNFSSVNNSSNNLR